MASATPRRMISMWSLDLRNSSSAPLRTAMSRIGSNITRSPPPLVDTSRLPTCAPDLILSLSRRTPASDPHGVLPGPVHADLAPVPTALEQHITFRTRCPRGRTMVADRRGGEPPCASYVCQPNKEAIAGWLGNELPHHV